ncbi:hypothetical protein FISHEDRAFT_43052 [Fistulina hepatica ATCC 64428]|uniref:Lytic polysaccharide monooxygenase n=1 Tax=Fistulina hepatica ATCC 64428 TaxID=1128425 RepID=A0A0D7AD09_9AGAR|nr:hypothetical protein FISHEDRAFT_43052 [Fistulina hepatica ATCC 64428]
MVTNPPPLRSEYNPYVSEADIDYSMTSPLDASGSNYPCKGYLNDTTGKESVANWTAGSTQAITLEGGANHDGGSCQFSISEDEGSTFRVIKSFIGECPDSLNVTLDVTVPTDATSGTSIFAWSWFNEIGDREMYMNCAIVTIEDGGDGLDSYPEILVAQLDNTECTIAEGTDVDYPDPGTEVVSASGDSKIGAPTGSCGATAASGSAAVASSTATATSVAASATATATSAAAAATSVAATTVAAATTADATTGTLTASAASSSATCTEGEIICDSETTWSECASGYIQSMGNMGSVPAGMECSDGSIVASSRRRSPGASHRRHWQSRRHFPASF